MQRLDDKFRRHCLSMHCLLGEEPTLEIEGVWLFRGKEIPQEMKDHPTFEYYDRRELSIDEEADRKLITEFWTAKVGEKVKGLTVQECKMFK